MRLPWIISVFLLAIVQVHAAGSDCGKASHPVEIFICESRCGKTSHPVESLICESRQLSTLDADMNRTYEEILSYSNNSQDIRKTQSDWLTQSRNRCKSEPCLESKYHRRIEKLRVLKEKLLAERIVQQAYRSTTHLEGVASKGSPAALRTLAILHHFGQGYKSYNIKLATNLYQKAAARGDALAAALLKDISNKNNSYHSTDKLIRQFETTPTLAKEMCESISSPTCIAYHAYAVWEGWLPSSDRHKTVLNLLIKAIDELDDGHLNEFGSDAIAEDFKLDVEVLIYTIKRISRLAQNQVTTPEYVFLGHAAEAIRTHRSEWGGSADSFPLTPGFGYLKMFVPEIDGFLSVLESISPDIEGTIRSTYGLEQNLTIIQVNVAPQLLLI